MMIDLYAKYTETYQRLRPPNTLQPQPWNALPPWLQAVWVEMAIWLAEMVYDSPEDQEQGWQKVVFASDCKDDNCPQCSDYYPGCPCPGPTMEDEYEYKNAVDK